VSRVVPSIHPFIATAPRGTAWHSTESARASASPQAYEATLKAAKAFALTAIDLFTDPALVRKIRNEFQRAQPEGISNSPGQDPGIGGESFSPCR
jgi:hypothetical protein